MAHQALTRKTPSAMPGVFVLALILFLMCVPVKNASAVTLVNPNGSTAQPYQYWADLSRVPTVDETLTIDTDMSTCDLHWNIGPLACNEREKGAIHLRDARCGEATWRECRLAVMHELGHQYQYRMPEWKHKRFAALARMQHRSWTEIAANGTLIETFAETYSVCAMGKGGWDLYTPTPGFSDRDAFRACHLIRIPNQR